MRKGLRYARVGFLTRQAILDGRLCAGCGKTSAGFTLKLWNEARLVCVFVVGGGGSKYNDPVLGKVPGKFAEFVLSKGNL